MLVALSTLVAASDAVDLNRGTVRLWIRVAFGVALLVAAGVGALLVKRVARRMKKAAAELGWTYRGEGTPLPPGVFSGFPFAGWSDGRVDHDIWGVWRDYRARAFVLRGSPPGYSARFHVTVLEIPRPMPLIEFHPRSNLQRNFDLESEVATGYPEFDKRWRVVCRDPQFASAIVTPQLVERLLAERSAIVPVTIDNQGLYTWAPVHRATKHDFQAVLTVLADVAEIATQRLGQLERGEVSLASSPAPMQQTGVAPKPKKRKNRNYLAILSVILPLTIVLVPVGIALGHLAIRASRRGEATNHRWAVVGLVFGYAMIAIFVAAAVTSQFA